MGSEIIVGRQDAGAYKFLLEGRYIVKEVLLCASSNVIDSIRGGGADRPPLLLFRGRLATPSIKTTM